MKHPFALLSPLALLALTALPVAADPANPPLTCASTSNPTACAAVKPGPTDPLVIVSGGKELKFEAEIADTEPKRNLGLMFRASMADTHAMIFDMGGPSDTGFWMKDCLISLDMLFLDAKGRVIAIAAQARPGSVRSVAPGFAYNAVLELNGGASKRLGVKVGDVVKHKLFKNLA
jgi:uncharacterized membrane protein (UPF0127 family)